MSFERHLAAQISRHPSMEPQDVVKLCYQSAYGAEHLLTDATAAEKYLEHEFACVSAADTDLYEVVSDSICRVHLAAWKYRGLPLSWLLKLFTASASINENGADVFRACLETAEAAAARGQARFSLPQWQAYLDAYKAAGMPAVHHSEAYRRNEDPHYRIVNCRYLRPLSLLESIGRTAAGVTAVEAMDGECWLAVTDPGAETLLVGRPDGRAETVPVRAHPFFYTAEFAASDGAEGGLRPWFRVLDSAGRVIAQTQ